jgi:cytochrome c biogenesis protein ResB
LFKKTIRKLRSTRLTIFLFVTLLVIFILGQLLPQKMLLKYEDYLAIKESWPVVTKAADFLGLFEIYTSPVAVVVFTLFFLNLLLVMSTRFSSINAKCNPPKLVDVSGTLQVQVSVPGTKARMKIVKKKLRGYSFYSDGDRFAAVRFRYGPFGHLLFHLSFFFLLIGGLMIFYTRTSGTALVIEGDEFSAQTQNFLTLRPSYVNQTPDISFGVVKISPVFNKNDLLSLNTDLEIYRGDWTYKRSIDVNHPAVFGDTSVLIMDVGVSPLLRLVNKDGRVIMDSYAGLIGLFKGKIESIEFPGTDIKMDFIFYPDYYLDDGIDRTRSLQLKNPFFHVSISEDGNDLFNDTIKMGETVQVGDLSFSIPDIRYLGKFQIVQEKGEPFLYIGFFMGFIGLLWRFLFYRREIRGQFREGVLYLSARDEYYKGQCQERLERMASALEKELK